MKELLPLVDAREPIACTIEAGERSSRRDLLLRLRAATLDVERIDAGVLLSFPPSTDGLFEEFSVSEKQCCAFFGFGFASGSLRWEAPPDASAIMDAIYRFFFDAGTSVDELDLFALR